MTQNEEFNRLARMAQDESAGFRIGELKTFGFRKPGRSGRGPTVRLQGYSRAVDRADELAYFSFQTDLPEEVHLQMGLIHRSEKDPAMPINLSCGYAYEGRLDQMITLEQFPESTTLLTHSRRRAFIPWTRAITDGNEAARYIRHMGDVARQEGLARELNEDRGLMELANQLPLSRELGRRRLVAQVACGAQLFQRKDMVYCIVSFVPSWLEGLTTGQASLNLTAGYMLMVGIVKWAREWSRPAEGEPTHLPIRHEDPMIDFLDERFFK